MQRRTFFGSLALLAVTNLGLESRAAETVAIIFGANGRLGSEMAKALLANNIAVIAFVRPRSDRSFLKGLNVTYVEGDARNRADVEKAFATDQVTLAINAIARRSRTELGLYDAAQRNITAAAKAAGTKQIIFFSSVGVGSSRSLYSDRSYEMFKSTMLERETAESELIESGVPYTIIRTGAVLDGEDKSGKAYLSEKPVLSGTTRGDLADIAAACAGQNKCMNKIYHAADDTRKLPFAE